MNLSEIESITMPHVATPDMLEAMKLLRQNSARYFAVLDELVPDGAEKRLARERFEEMLMWANKGITKSAPVADRIGDPRPGYPEHEATFDLKREPGQS